MGKRKENIKDKKLQSIRNAKIFATIKKNKRGEYYFYFEVNRVIEPAARPRTSSKFSGMYDPLSCYKNHLKTTIMEQLNLNVKKKVLKKVIPYSGPIRSVVKIYRKPNKTDSLKEKFIKIMNLLPLLIKPDIDNVEKTLWDTCNKLIIEDDNHIYSTKTEKYYGEEDKTVFKLYFEKDKFPELMDEFKRLGKEESLFIKSLYEDEE